MPSSPAESATTYDAVTGTREGSSLELARILDERAIDVRFHPVVELATGDVVGLKASAHGRDASTCRDVSGVGAQLRRHGAPQGHASWFLSW